MNPRLAALLYFPAGASGGIATVTLTFLATQHGLTIAEGSLFAGAWLLPGCVMFLWAPLVDTTLSARAWYALSVAALAIVVGVLVATPIGRERLPLLIAADFACGVLASLVYISAGAIVARTAWPARRGASGGYAQAGNLAGLGLTGTAGLVLSRVASPLIVGVVVGCAIGTSALALLWVPPEPERRGDLRLGASIRAVLQEVATTFRARDGKLLLIVSLVPVGTGAAGTTLTQAVVASTWGAGEQEVGFVQGVLGSLAQALGAISSGVVADRLPKRALFCVAGLGCAAVSLTMLLLPPTLGAYVACSIAYAFATGASFGAWMGVAMETIGTGAAATKLTLPMSLAMFPLWWAGMLVARVAHDFGPQAMLGVDAVLAVIGVSIIAAASRVIR